MDKQSIEGYARAIHALEDVLKGKVDGEKLANMFDDACENPKTAIVEYMRLARANHVLNEQTKRAVGEALDLVDSEEDGPLPIEKQGDFIIAWFHCENAAGVGINEAAERLGVTSEAVRQMIDKGDLRATKSRRRWIIDSASLEGLVAARASK